MTYEQKPTFTANLEYVQEMKQNMYKDSITHFKLTRKHDSFVSKSFIGLIFPPNLN